ncbi:hypothetical protein HHK36_002763 [Tetracentron sinense]|uniref:Uncharacterized protein n=1 Tax=Tetracentron sinense TaxID=13715 RepID=A0A835DRF9_TETSI|nr:hypothetical protein HHK36_002763 [Tetracentron sinense]
MEPSDLADINDPKKLPQHEDEGARMEIGSCSPNKEKNRGDSHPDDLLIFEGLKNLHPTIRTSSIDFEALKDLDPTIGNSSIDLYTENEFYKDD